MMPRRLHPAAVVTALLTFAACQFAAGQMPQQGQPPPPKPLPHPNLPAPPVIELGLPWWIYALAALGLLLLLGLVLWLLLRPAPPAGILPTRPWQTAMDRLQRLRESAGVASHHDIAAAVSETLRGYFLARYKIPAPFRTTQEIFYRDEIPQTSLRLHRYAPLAALWDELVFAPLPASADEARALVDKAILHLEEDRP